MNQTAASNRQRFTSKPEKPDALFAMMSLAAGAWMAPPPRKYQCAVC